MNSDATSVLNALESLVQGTNSILLRGETAAVLQQSVGINPYDAIRTAVQKLVAQNKFPASLGQQLMLGLDVARTSGNNPALVKAVIGSSSFANLQNLPASSDAKPIQDTVSSDAGATPATDAATTSDAPEDAPVEAPAGADPIATEEDTATDDKVLE
jgi:hypothetical protein